MKIKRSRLKRLVAFAATTPFALYLTIGVYLVGRAISPVAGGHPVLYTPDVIATQSYTAQVNRWTAELIALDSTSGHLLNTPPDLYTLSQDVDNLAGAVTQLDQDVSLLDPPPALHGLQNVVLTAVHAYEQEISKLSDWVAAPAAARQADALQALSAAQPYLTALENNPWRTSK